MMQLDGVVIHVDSIYHAPAQTNRSLKLFVGVILVPVVLAAGLTLVLVSVVRRIVFPGPSATARRGLVGESLSRALGYTLSRRLLTGPQEVPVRDVRVRDASGQDHLVRIHGQMIQGSVAVGDSVRFWGVNKRGTLQMQSGYNHQTRSDIKVR